MEDFAQKIAYGGLTNLYKCILTFYPNFSIRCPKYLTPDSFASFYEPMPVTRISLPQRYWTTIYVCMCRVCISSLPNYSRLKYIIYLICYTRINHDVLFMCKIQFYLEYKMSCTAVLILMTILYWHVAHCVHLNVTVYYNFVSLIWLSSVFYEELIWYLSCHECRVNLVSTIYHNEWE